MLNAACRVDGDDECAAVSLEGEDGAHDVLRLAADPLAELEKGLEVRLVEGVPDDLDVHLVQVLLVDAALEEGSCVNRQGDEVSSSTRIPIQVENTKPLAISINTWD